MSTEIAKADMPHNEMMSMAKLFAESKMFKDVTQMAQAFVKIQAGKEIGIAPFAAMSGIHIIQGKPTVGAGLMAGCVKGSGRYDYKVVEMTDTVCSIDFYNNAGKVGNSTFTKEDAIKAGTQNMAKYPKNMLFARAISNGVKWFTPDIFTMPVYTPEEMGDATITEDIIHEEVAEQAPAPKKRLNAKAIAAAITRIQAGEKDILEKIQETCDLTPEQLSELQEANFNIIMATPTDGATIIEPA